MKDIKIYLTVLAGFGCASGFAEKWSYPPLAFPEWELQRACAYKEEAGLNVLYPGKFAAPPDNATFRLNGGKPMFVHASYSYGLPCLKGTGYEVLDENGKWVKCDVFESEGDLPPHRTRFPARELKPKFADGLWDAGREVVAYVRMKSKDRPLFTVGESIPEARADLPHGYEQTCLAEPTEMPGVWRSNAPLAFRYARMKTPVEEVTFILDEAELEVKRPFTAGTAREREIWRVSTETLRLCARHFYVDSVKRDRLPWSGDLVVSLLASANSFRDGATVRNSLDALDSGGPELGEVNGIVDYSDWWVICHWLYRHQFDDAAYTKSRWPLIRRRTNALLRLADGDGFIRGTNAWLFIDHGPSGNSDLGPKTTALNILQSAALMKASELAEEFGETEDAARWRGQSKALSEKIRRAAFDTERGMFRSDVFDRTSPIRRHANFLAMLFGLTTEAESAKIAAELAKDELPVVGTTWMSAIEGVALLLHGHREVVRQRIESIWGGMLDKGATTFWEQWQPWFKGDDVYTFYGRPFGLALCHTTSSGPVFLLPMIYAEKPENPFAAPKNR